MQRHQRDLLIQQTIQESILEEIQNKEVQNEFLKEDKEGFWSIFAEGIEIVSEFIVNFIYLIFFLILLIVILFSFL
ncbi:hypothetical protein ACDQ58_03655 [Fusobacterium animalis]|jgi:hypothetical protein|uniref:hypothetical protein n=1 Tax=Fusobacterium animalis TaxID=76859 RepID=UPI00204A88E5|nr:MAG TPA: hypothetical protein [Caudoviricetes sp.]DAW75392.1 MAG TPA: hypothetical protein [Caudoviricetes sp.]